MNKSIRTTILASAAIAAGVFGLFWNGEVTPPPGVGIVTSAEAIIGMPLTPMSYAGVARRTTRRCVVGVYYC